MPTHGRNLAIRRLSDPYAIWIAETMSQQTQIVRVAESFPAFLDAFPDMRTLAAAAATDLIRAWGALGYPRRALALRAAARTIIDRYSGDLPSDVEQLESLPGVGPYTARAVAATAFGVPVTALDVNARRVLGRVLGRAARGAFSGRLAQATADAMAPSDHAAAWNHALMDLGATICRRTPDCHRCPLRTMCAWAGGDRPISSGEAIAASGVAFRDTNRYVRGRVLATLRDIPRGAWTHIDPRALSIEPERVARALSELQGDGLIEVDDRRGARLPTG